MRWLGSTTDSLEMSLSKLWEIVKDRQAWRAAVHQVTKSRTWLSNWTTTTKRFQFDGSKEVHPKAHPPNAHDLPHCPYPPCFLHLCRLRPSLWHLLNTCVCPLLGSDCVLRCLSPLSLRFICQLLMCLSWLIPGASAHALLVGQSYRSLWFWRQNDHESSKNPNV